MLKKLLFILIAALVNFSVLATSIIPHHHHEDASVVCLCSDVHKCACDKEHNHHSDNDCGVKQNLTAHFSENKKEHNCQCETVFPHIGDHAWIVVLIYQSQPQEFEVESLLRPGLITYKSVVYSGANTLRAPPVA